MSFAVRELLEDIDDADGFEDQQHEKHDADDGQRVRTGRHVLHLAGERAQFCIRQRGDAGLDLRRVDAKRLELRADLVTRERGIDGREVGGSALGFNGLQRADDSRVRDERRAQVEYGGTQHVRDDALRRIHLDQPPDDDNAASLINNRHARRPFIGQDRDVIRTFSAAELAKRVDIGRRLCKSYKYEAGQRTVEMCIMVDVAARIPREMPREPEVHHGENRRGNRHR